MGQDSSAYAIATSQLVICVLSLSVITVIAKKRVPASDSRGLALEDS
ncbi:hypothetical protein H6F96_00005 [Microcoleus sp. FACHB-53]|nr:hypothetical protein [Microcoleus sp. FACHB-53]